MQSIAQWLSAFLVPVVAIAGVSIAFIQARTARRKLQLDLFDRRLVVYDAARSLISSIMTSGRTSNEQELKFLEGIRGARWLFDEEVVSYLEKDLWHKVVELGTLQSMNDERSEQSEERTARIYEAAAIKKWLVSQLAQLDEIFAPYLRVDH